MSKNIRETYLGRAIRRVIAEPAQYPEIHRRHVREPMWGLRGVQGSIFQGHQNPRASEFKGVEGPLIDKGFQWVSVSKIQRVSGKIYTRKGFEYWRIQNLRGFKGKHIHFQWIGVSKIQRVSGKIYTQVWPRSKYHPPCVVKPLCDLTFGFYWTIGGAHSTWRYSSVGI